MFQGETLDSTHDFCLDIARMFGALWLQTRSAKTASALAIFRSLCCFVAALPRSLPFVAFSSQLPLVRHFQLFLMPAVFE